MEKKKLAIVIATISILVIAGLTYMQSEKVLEEKEIIEIAKQTEEVKSYLEEHPNAEIEVSVITNSIYSEWVVIFYDDIYELHPVVRIATNGSVISVSTRVAG